MSLLSHGQERFTVPIMITLLVVGLVFAVKTGLVTSLLSVNILTNPEVSFSAVQAGFTKHTIPVIGGIDFGSDCEKIKALQPEINIDCAEKQRRLEMRDLISLTQTSPCITLSLLVDDKKTRISKNQPVEREGYSIMLKEFSTEYVYGKLSGDELSTRFLGYSANFDIIIDHDALKVAVDNLNVTFTKKLPSCTTAGVSVSDSARILGGTVIDNKDGTFTNVGNTVQSEVVFPKQQSGSATLGVPMRLGAHSIVFKPFVVIGNNKLALLPEQKSNVFVESMSGGNPQARNALSSELQVPSLIDRIKAFFKKLFGGIK